MKVTSVVPTLLLAALIHCCHSKTVFKWNQRDIRNETGVIPNTTWWAASLEVTSERIYVSFIDVGARSNNSYKGFVGYTYKAETSKTPTFKIFPDRKMYSILNTPMNATDAITTPIAIRADKCGRLWILDANVTNTTTQMIKGPPSLFIYDIATKNLLRREIVPSEVLKQHSSFLINFVVDDSAECEKVFAYIADFNGQQMLSYNFKTRSFLRFQHNYMAPNPLVRIDSQFLYTQQNADSAGIFGLTLNKNEKNLYFHPLASTMEFSVHTSMLHAPYFANRIPHGNVTILGNRTYNSESGLTAFDENTKIIFSSEVNTKKIGCWNTLDKFQYITLDKKYDGFVTDMKVAGDNLWVLVDEGVFGINIHVSDIKSLVKDTKCYKPTSTSSGGLTPKNNLGNQGTTIKTSILLYVSLLVPVLHKFS